MEQSILPEDLVEFTIEMLVPWEPIYTVPWAIIADADGYMWINKKYPVLKSPFKDTVVEVCREIHDEDEFIVVNKASIVGWRYSREQVMARFIPHFNAHLGEIDTSDYLPVFLDE